MLIQINTDKNIKGEERTSTYFKELIEGELDRFSDYITRLEVHLSDENGNKEGKDDIRCLIEARVEGKQPIAVKSQADTIEKAISASVEKLQASLQTIIGRMTSH